MAFRHSETNERLENKLASCAGWGEKKKKKEGAPHAASRHKLLGCKAKSVEFYESVAGFWFLKPEGWQTDPGFGVSAHTLDNFKLECVASRCNYFTAPDRVRGSPILNHKQHVWYFFSVLTIPRWAACVRSPPRAGEKEQIGMHQQPDVVYFYTYEHGIQSRFHPYPSPPPPLLFLFSVQNNFDGPSLFFLLTSGLVTRELLLQAACVRSSVPGE